MRFLFARTIPARKKARAAWLAAAICWLALWCSGCGAMRPLQGLPVASIADELKVSPRGQLRPIDLSMLRQTPPREYVVDAGDVLGIYIEGILSNKDDVPPVQAAHDLDLPPSLGYPIPVRQDGTIALPLADPIPVAGLTFREVEQRLRYVYTQQKPLLRTGQEKILVGLQKPRTFRILVLRQEGGNTAAHQGSCSGPPPRGDKRGVGRAIALPAYRNDVLNALAETGGLPGLDAENTVYIMRRRGPAGLPGGAVFDPGGCPGGCSRGNPMTDTKSTSRAALLVRSQSPDEPVPTPPPRSYSIQGRARETERQQALLARQRAAWQNPPAHSEGSNFFASPGSRGATAWPVPAGGSVVPANPSLPPGAAVDSRFTGEAALSQWDPAFDRTAAMRQLTDSREQHWRLLRQTAGQPSPEFTSPQSSATPYQNARNLTAELKSAPPAGRPFYPPKTRLTGWEQANGGTNPPVPEATGNLPAIMAGRDDGMLANRAENGPAATNLPAGPAIPESNFSGNPVPGTWGGHALPRPVSPAVGAEWPHSSMVPGLPGGHVFPAPSASANSPQLPPGLAPSLRPEWPGDGTIDNPNVIRIPLRLHPGETPNFLEQDILLWDGDVVYVDSRDHEVFYTGGLLGGGQFSLPRDYDLDVLDAIAIAEGHYSRNFVNRPTKALGGCSVLNQDITVGASQVVVLRRLADGNEVPIKIDLREALRNTNQRLTIQPGDRIVLEYTRCEAVAAFLERHLFEGFLIGAATTFLYNK